MIQNILFNVAWVASCLPDWVAFHFARYAPERAQRRVLKCLLKKHGRTDWGRQHHFDRIRTVQAFQDQHPLTSYEDYREAIERIASGCDRVLTNGPVRLLEPTGGSTGPGKLIPYTDELRRQFQRGIAPWIVDLYLHHPKLFLGRSYWSVSPAGQQEARTHGGIPVGFDDDSEYLGRLGAYLMRCLFAVPPEVKNIRDMAAFRYVTLLFLLAARDLTLISVWHPTFLTLLLEPLTTHWESLCGDLAAGTITRDLSLDESLRRRLERRLKADSHRAREIEVLFRSATGRHVPLEALWPRLTLISCWTDAHASLAVPQLQEQFPRTLLQPKGLLATEGIISFPLAGTEGAIPALRSHFFEFLADNGNNERPRLLHELKTGQRYAVVITTGGGLYRYRTNDMVEVVGMNGRLPLLRFVGRDDHVSDLVGEKLHETYVSEAVSSVFDAFCMTPRFWMIAPERRGDGFGYVLFVEPQGKLSIGETTFVVVAEDVDRALQKAFHYRYARQLGQLGPVRVAMVEHGQERYLEGCAAFGQRLGDVKPAYLESRLGWSRYFETMEPDENHSLFFERVCVLPNHRDCEDSIAL